MRDVRLCFDRKGLEEVLIPEEDRFLNMMIVGPTGTGKSSQILTPLIYQDMLNDDCGVTIIDPKEDLAESILELSKSFTYRNVIYVDPSRDDCPKLNPFKGSADEVIKNLTKIFTSGVTSSATEKLNMEMNRTLIIKSITLLKTFPNLCGGEIDIETYSNFISNRFNEAREKVAKLHESIKSGGGSSDDLDLCEWFLKKYFEPKYNIFEVCSFLRVKIEDLASNKYLSKILTPTQSENNLINFDEHLMNGDVVIINTKNTILGYLGKAFGEFIMMSYMNAVFRRKHFMEANHRGHETMKANFLYVDEFTVYSPVLTDLFTQGRSFRVGTHISIQNRTLLKICGEEDSHNQSFVIESNTRNLVLFPGLNGEDADYYSKQFFNLNPSEILYRPFGQIVYRIVKNKTIQPPSIGLVFFIDEDPSDKSIKEEFRFGKEGELITFED